MNPDHCHWCGSAVEPGEAFLAQAYLQCGQFDLPMLCFAACNACVESWEREGWRREEL